MDIAQSFPTRSSSHQIRVLKDSQYNTFEEQIEWRHVFFIMILRLLPFVPVAHNVVICACVAMYVRLMPLNAEPLET